jgi:hypothetical protein
LCRAAGHLLASSGKLLPLLPDQQAQEGRKALYSLREVVDSELSKQIELFRLPEIAPSPKNSLEEALEQTHEWIQSLRSWIHATNVPVKHSILFLGLADRLKWLARR